MTKLSPWRRDPGLPGIKDGGSISESLCVDEEFCVLTVVVFKYISTCDGIS